MWNKIDQLLEIEYPKASFGKRGIVYLFLCFIGISTSFSQSYTPSENYHDSELSAHEIHGNEFEKALEEVDYESNEPKTEKEKKREEQAQKDFENNLGPILKFLLIAGGIGLLIFLLIKLMDAESIFSPKNRKIKGDTTDIDLDDIEENLHESDLEGFIQKALDGGNYALAIRLYYLAILKELSISNQIKWKKDKTNREYLREMGGKQLANEFRGATLIFERVWYGTGELTENIFMEIEPNFKGLLKQAGTNKS